MPTRWHYHHFWIWSSILKVLKVISLQYLYNISKKEVRKEDHFLHADEHQSFYKLGFFFFFFLMEVARYQGIIQKKLTSGSRTLSCLLIFFRNFILIRKCQKWSLNRGTLVPVIKVPFYSSKWPFFVLPDAALWL